MLFCIILFGVYAAIFATSLVWYRMKLRFLDYTGRIPAEVTEVEPMAKPEGSRKRVVVEYEVQGKKCRKTYYWDLSMPPIAKGDRVEMVCDEADPKRAELELLLRDREAAKKRWMLVPILTFGVLVIITFCLLPTIFGWDRKRRELMRDIAELLMMLAAFKAVVCKVRDPNSKLNRKKHGKLKGIAILTFMLIIIAGYLVLTILSQK